MLSGIAQILRDHGGGGQLGASGAQAGVAAVVCVSSAVAGDKVVLRALHEAGLEVVVTGRLNKQIAADLDVSEVTVKVHRGQVMRKMRATSLAELVRMADKLGIAASKS